ncbi:MAG: sortase [bacterium]
MLIWHDRRPVNLRRARRLRVVANILIVTGVLLLVSPAGWVAYTALAVAPAQTAALAAWDGLANPVGAQAAARALPPAAAHAPARPALLLTIPRIGLRRAVPPGAHPENLRRYGAGHISWTSLPGGPGMVGIAGHRTTYGAPFFRLNALRPGDLMHLDYQGRRFTYAVSRSEVVTPDRVDILEGTGRQRIALVSCTPVYSAARRLVVIGTLASVTPTP